MDELFLQRLNLSELSLQNLERIFPKRYSDFTEESMRVPTVERYFQLLVDSVVDCNQRILELRGKDVEETYFGTFTSVADEGLIPDDLARRVAPSVGLRNMIVHRYERVQRRKMYESIKKFISIYRTYLRTLAKNQL